MRRTRNATSLITSLAASLVISLPPASAAPGGNFPLTGKVLDAYVDQNRTHVYKLETESSIYKLLCFRHLFIGTIPASCSLNGNPLQVGDEIRLRTDGKTVTFYAGNGKEQSLSILLEETKILPPLPASSRATEQGAVILAHGFEPTDQIASSSSPAASPSSSPPTMPTGPVLAVPVTGGPAVPVIATGPVSGGIVNGIGPNGQPVTAIAVSPANISSSTPLSNNTIQSGPGWTSVLYLQTQSYIYKIQCASMTCVSAARKLNLGDLLIARAEGKADLSEPSIRQPK